MPNVYSPGRSKAAETRPAFLAFIRQLSGTSLAIGAVVGLIAGLLIGWVFWPVEWKNAWPADLSPEARAQYLASVAQVYTYYNDEQAAEIARGRLLNLNDDLAGEIAAAQAYFDENPQRDSRIYITMLGQLAAGLGVSSPDIIMPSAAGAPAEAAEEAATQESPSWLTWTLSFLGILILVGGGIYLISKLAQSRKRVVDHELEGAPDDEFDDDFGVDRYGPSAGPQGARGVSSAQPVDDYAFAQEPDDEFYSPGAAIDEIEEELDDEYFVDEEQYEDEDMEPVAAPVARQAGAVRQTSGRTLDTFIAHYQAGVIDFDQSFKIVDPESNRYVGECGMGVNVKNGILQDNPENVIALDVWLYDQKMEKSLGNRTRVLLSEYALDRNLEPALMRERPNDPPPIIAQPGVSFQLKGQSLILDCEVIEAEYVKSERDAGVFQNVRLEMTVRSRA
ncbi:MAG: hypothetical protein QM346_15395 [Chloroflexota bacterium]|nr:hypothetical protein [Chloroflexota bacterium]